MYRRLPEQGRAREQLDRQLERRVRALERRTRYPGAAREVGPADDIAVTTGSSTVYLTLNVDAGSWLVMARLNVMMAVNNAIERASVYLNPYKLADGGTLDSVAPPAHWAVSGVASSSSAVRQPFTLVGYARWSEPVRLDLHVALSTVGAAHSVTLNGLYLLATPA